MPFDHTEEHRDERMIVVQTNLDDMNPEFCGYIADKLFEAGANDVYWVPIIMKKGRPGVMLNVLIREELLETVENVVFRETTTLGLRYMPVSCHRLGRSVERVSTPWGEITVKVGYYKGEAVQAAPENKDCERAAKAYGVPLKTVYEEVKRLYWNAKRGHGDSRG